MESLAEVRPTAESNAALSPPHGPAQGDRPHPPGALPRAKYALLATDLTGRSGRNRHHRPTVDDDLLALMFTACHPVLPRESRLATTLRLLGGLTTDEIARAFLVPSATVGQRSPAKRT